MRSRKPEWKMSRSRRCYCWCADSAAGSWLLQADGLVAVVGGDGGTQYGVENGYGMGWSRSSLDEAGMLSPLGSAG